MKLPDYKILDFSGGLVTNKSDYEMKKNELKNSLNFDIDERGKLKRRRGIRQFGGTQTGKIIDNSTIFSLHVAGAVPNVYHILLERDNTPDVWKIVGNWLTTAATVGDTTLVCAATGLLAASGTVEIEGDLIAYTAKNGDGVTLTGVTGIIRAHPIGSMVTQIQSIATATSEDYRSGGYFSALNNLLFLNGRVGSATFDGTNITSIADADEGFGLYSLNYRDRIYVFGSGATGFDPRRVLFSDAGDSTSWTSTNWFDVEDERGESITAGAILHDALGIFKMNSIFTYDEVQLKQRQWEVGAYNSKVIQKIGNLVFIFCPAGVFITNFYSAKKISDPVEKYLKNFQPIFDSTVGRTVINTFSGQLGDNYFLYIGDIIEPEVLNDVVLIYNTNLKSWTVHSGYTDFVHFASLSRFMSGNPYVATNTLSTQEQETLFASDTGGKYFRLFEDRFYDNGSIRTYRGGDITYDCFSETQLPISAVGETPLLDMDNASFWKEIGGIRILVEQGDFDISYRLDKGKYGGITDWVSLGNFNDTNVRTSLPDNEGYRIAFRITNNSKDVISIFNGLIVEDIEAKQKK